MSLGTRELLQTPPSLPEVMCHRAQASWGGVLALLEMPAAEVEMRLSEGEAHPTCGLDSFSIFQIGD